MRGVAVPTTSLIVVCAVAYSDVAEDVYIPIVADKFKCPEPEVNMFLGGSVLESNGLVSRTST